MTHPTREFCPIAPLVEVSGASRLAAPVARDYVRTVHIAEQEGHSTPPDVSLAHVVHFDGERVGHARAWTMTGGRADGTTLTFEVPSGDLVVTPESHHADPMVTVHRVQLWGRDVLTPPMPWPRPGTVDLSGGALVVAAIYVCVAVIGAPPAPDDALDDVPQALADRLTVFRDTAGEWRWKLQAANCQIIAVSGEGYQRKSYALEVAECSTMRTVERIIED